MAALRHHGAEVTICLVFGRAVGGFMALWGIHNRSHACLGSLGAPFGRMNFKSKEVCGPILQRMKFKSRPSKGPSGPAEEGPPRNDDGLAVPQAQLVSTHYDLSREVMRDLM